MTPKISHPTRLASSRRAFAALTLCSALALGACADVSLPDFPELPFFETDKADPGLPPEVGALRAKAEAGDAQAQYALGSRYLTGKGVERDEDAAATWFERAAQGGHAGAQYLLGASYYTGDGRARNDARAFSWLTKAAGQGHPRAQYMLAGAFTKGRGVAPDPAWAARWYGKAAQQGHVKAQYHLGLLSGAGIGVPKDFVQSARWLGLAARQGHEGAAAAQAKVAAKLSAPEKAKVKALIARSTAAPRTAYADEPTVRFVQFTLARLGHPPGPVDGLLGAHTRGAIAAYQAKAGLPVDRAVTTRLVERLRASAASKS